MPRFGGLLDLLRRARELQDVPDPKDAVAFRDWVGEAASFFDALGDRTPNDADDRGAQLLRDVVADDGAWETFHEMLLVYLHVNELPLDDDVTDIARAVGVDRRDVLGVWMILAGAMRLRFPRGDTL